MAVSLDALFDGLPSRDRESDSSSSDTDSEEDSLPGADTAEVEPPTPQLPTTAELAHDIAEFSKSVGRDVITARAAPVHEARGEPSAGHRLPAGYHPQPADFQLVRVVGRGAYGKVLLVTHTLTGRVYAMKVDSTSPRICSSLLL
jgi:hypothetical protein